ncbi:HvnC protein [Citrobacter amalonaticus]|uniref:HvnC protein n=1 Tax=Citrobacter amalonaticus TaxID=35703 RepID=UPI00300D0B59
MNKLMVLAAMSLLLAFNSFAFDHHPGEADFRLEHNSRDYSVATGEDIANYLNQDYNNVQDNCGSSTEPAFLCTGVMIRAALPGAGYHIWDPSPSALSTGGISFSYLRADDNSTRFVHNETSGFIFYPYYYAPEDKYTDIDVMCSFPLDADTVNRDQNGCGKHSGDYPKSSPCQSQGIMTGQAWYENDTSMDGQCGFDVSDNSPYNTADGFLQSIKARTYLSESSREEQNEIRLKTWASGMEQTLPIEAFWYIAGDAEGLSDAQYNQKDIVNTTNGAVWVPVIMVTPPANTSGIYTFTYRKSDQIILVHEAK